MLKNNPRILRVTTKAVNMLSATPIPKVKAKPWTRPAPSLSPNQKSIAAIMRVVMFPSRIAGHARLNPISIADPKPHPPRISSLIRSKINTFASTANPNESTNAAIPERVRTTGISLNILSTIDA